MRAQNAQANPVKPSHCAKPPTALETLNWRGRPAHRYSVSLDAVASLLPRFVTRRVTIQPQGRRVEPPPAAVEVHDAQLFDAGVGVTRSLVAVVSPSYQLVQHRDLVETIQCRLDEAGLEPAALECHLILGAGGASMALDIRLPSYLMPADGYKLGQVLSITNGVDGRTRLIVDSGWVRHVCSNGMIFWGQERWSERHTQYAGGPDGLTSWFDVSVTRRLNEVGPKATATLERMLAVSAGANLQYDLCDIVLRQRWGLRDAARVWHICRTGFDAEPMLSKRRGLDASVRIEDLDFRTSFQVPGAAAPVDNAYHLGQALSWVASHDRSVSRRLDRTREVSELLDMIPGLN